MESIIDIDLISQMNSNLKDLTTKERDSAMWAVLAYLTDKEMKGLAQPMFDLVNQNGDLQAWLLKSNLSASELVAKSSLSTTEKELILFYIDDLSLLTGRGAGPQSVPKKRRKPSKKEIDTYSNSIKLWTAIIAALSTLTIAYNGYETNQINRENMKLQYELKQRELDQKDIELRQRIRELDLQENQNE
ncbi:hypothetical protein DOK67_0000154 [Enterococcus sp. DIV0212c]|uniref:hypothetical protein n=1 Tax=Enterococcus sp. DIV0212c TaxID=2230867 RepID=UPI001A9A9F47|nr:hypothetical protein [Enterococcus sp. DIV0212c]MBO1354002.1 hypothetical protein [Enterococcus sp. DIV0212c]